MGEYDGSDDGRTDRSLGTALADVAAGMPDDPYRVDGVHAKVRHLRNRRRTVRVMAGVATAAAVSATLVVVRPDATHISTVPASQPTTPLPSCAAVLAAMPATSADPADQKKAAIDGGKQDASAGIDRPGSDLRGVKGIGTIVSATAEIVTVTLEEPSAGQPGEIAATVSPTAELRDGETKVDALPSLNPGDQVAFAASLAGDGSYQLIYLEAHIPANPTPAGDAVTPDTKAAGATVADGAYGKALAKVVSVQSDSITLNILESDLGVQDITAATGPATAYFAGDQACADPELAPGQVIVAILERGDGGTYAAQQIALFPAGTA